MIIQWFYSYQLLLHPLRLPLGPWLRLQRLLHPVEGALVGLPGKKTNICRPDIPTIAGHGPLEFWGLGWGVYYIKFVCYYNGIRRLGGGGFITLTPCVPRYDSHVSCKKNCHILLPDCLVLVLLLPDPPLHLLADLTELELGAEDLQRICGKVIHFCF